MSAEEKRSRGAAGGLENMKPANFYIFMEVKRKRDESKIVFRGI